MHHPGHPLAPRNILSGLLIALLGVILLAAMLTDPRLARPDAPPTVQLSAPVASTAAPQPTPDGARRWKLVRLDTFDTNEAGWTTGDYHGERIDGNRAIVGGEYMWVIKSRTGAFWRTQAPGEPLNDSYAAVQVRAVSNPASKRYLIVRHQDDDNYYAFGLCGHSQGYLLSLHLKGGWSTVVPCTAHPAITEGSNLLAVAAEGETLRLFINDQHVQTIEGAKIPAGGFGLAAEIIGEDEAVIAFDDFEVRRKP